MPPIRSLSLAHRLVWNFSGNLNAPAVALGDVDNDGVSQLHIGVWTICAFVKTDLLQDNEFVVGNVHGDLAIFKGEHSDIPWWICYDLGTVRVFREFPFHDWSNLFLDHLRLCWGRIQLRIGKHAPLSDARGPQAAV